MFARIKKTGNYQYLQLVENRKEKGKVKQRVIGTLGRIEHLKDKKRIETLIRSLSRFNEKAMMVLSGQSDVTANVQKIGPVLIFERLWEESGVKYAVERALDGRKFEFNVERAVFLTVLHRLMVSGSDRWCDKWRSDYAVKGIEDVKLHHLYRAMAFLGQELDEEPGPLGPRRIKDRIEELLFKANRHLFSELDLVFMDTTSIYFEGEGGDFFGERGFSKDHRPDLKQMVVGAIIDDNGRPICCELWPGNTADVKTMIPVVDRLKDRFGIKRFCIVADRGMISDATIAELEERNISYILGARMRLVKHIKEQVLTRAGRYSKVHPDGSDKSAPSPLKVKSIVYEGRRYVVCINERQARKEAADREAIVSLLKDRLKQSPKGLVGNKGFRKYLSVNKGSMSINYDKLKAESRFDGKWVLRTNTDLSASKVALKYKELWQVERVFRDAKSLLETRPVYHQNDANIAGHVFCSFLALVLRKELDRRLAEAGHRFSWNEIKHDLKSLQLVEIEEDNQRFAVRSQVSGCCGNVFKAVGVSLPPTVTELD